MMTETITQVAHRYIRDTVDVTEWCNDVYNHEFSKYFDSERALYKRLQSKRHPITDEELEDILTNLPLQLFAVSEALSQLKVCCEVVRIGTKDRAAKIEKSSTANTATARKEEASYAILGDQLLQAAYGAIIDRVEREISYSRELIMSAKKIWDSRRRTEESVPVSEIVPDSESSLPAYKPQTYIK